MATGGGEKDAFRRSGLDRTPQEELLTPGRAELVRLARAKSAWDQDPTGIFNDEQRAAIAGAAPTLGEEVDNLLLRLANEVKRVADGGFDANVCADVYNLYVIKKYCIFCEACIFLVGNSFTVLWIVDLLTMLVIKISILLCRFQKYKLALATKCI
jgi:hypothetical protein